MRDRILAVYDTLTACPNAAWLDYVTRHGATVIRLSMPELARTAPASRSRPSHASAPRLGYDGFRSSSSGCPEPRRRHAVRPPGRGGQRPPSRHRRQGIRPHHRHADGRPQRAVSRPDRARHPATGQRARIEFYGCGNSGIVALDIQHKILPPRHSHHGLLQIRASSACPPALLRHGDVAVLVSNSGRTWDMLTAATLAPRRREACWR